MTFPLFDRLAASPRAALLAGGAASAAALAAALIGQYGFGLYPCVLCLYQRVPFAVVIGLAVLGLFRAGWARPLLGLAGLLFLAGAGIAAFHTGVEQRWWTGTDACGLKLDPSDLEALRQQILNAPRARCDEIPWSFLGLSMAAYNVFYSLMLAAFSLTVFSRSRG